MITTRARAAVLSSIVIVVAGTAGCSAMQASGRWTRESGESMEAYSKENEGAWGSVVGFFGRTNKAVGESLESMAGGDTATGAAAGSGATPTAVPVSVSTAPVAAVEPAPSTQAPAANASITARAQTRLQELGYSVGKADGVVGPRTRAALLKYQRAKGLTESGKLDPATLQALGLA